MKKFILGLLTGVILTFLTGLVIVFSLARLGGEPKPTVEDGSVLVLRLEGELPERAPVELPLPFFEQQAPSTVREIWSTLRKAAADKRISAILLEPRGVSVGWAKLQEIRADIETFRKSGKPVIAYLRQPGSREYYLATAADKIYMTPEEYLDVKGLRAELMYFRHTLDKLGVSVDVEHAGKYKDFGDMFVRDNMSPETAEVMNSVLDDLYGNLVGVIAKARKKNPEQMRASLDEGPFLAEKALADGLVDGLLYEDQVTDELKKRLKTDSIKRVGHREYARVPASSLGLEGGPKVALLVAQGGITRGDSDGISDDDGITSISFNRLLRQVSNEDSIKGVVVRIDSPGGDAIASDEIWREMNRLSKKKPMVISMSDAAASGGYYMAMTGDPIVAYPGTFTGSIGVVFGKANLKGFYDKIGITKDILTRGRFAAIDSDYTPLSEPARAKLRTGIEASYHTFVSKVAQARKKEYEEIAPLAEGRVWLGSQAKGNGLVDELGGLDRAFELVRERAKIGKDQKITIVTYPAKKNLIELLMGRDHEVTLQSLLPESLRGAIQGWQLGVWAQPGLKRVMPFSIEVR